MKSESKGNKGFLSYLSESGGATKGILLLSCTMALAGAILMGGDSCRYESPASAEVSEAQELSSLLSSLEGVGRCEVSIRYGEGEEVLGVVVLCDGADRVETRERIVLLVSTLFHIGTNRIRVEKLSG